MTWFGGSFSNLTGQLSNLTKDILTEGTEEITDPSTELRLAKEKIEELHSYLTSTKLESERLKRINKDLEEKAESSELQINAISREYRAVLENKEKELNALKGQHAEFLEHQARSAASAVTNSDTNSSHHTAPKAVPSSYQDDTNSFGAFNYGGEDPSDWDFDDSIRLQRENNRLRSDLQNATAEVKHWRSVAGQLGQKAEHQDETNTSSTTVLELQRRVKELESSLSKKGEEIQQQATSLHEHHRHKVSTLKERHAKEVKSLQEKLAALEHQLSDASSGSQHSGTLPESDRPNISSIRLAELERKLASALTEKEKAQNARVHLEGVLEELQQEVERLQDLNERQQDEAQSNDKVEALQMQLEELSQSLEKSQEENKRLKSSLQNVQSDAVRDRHSLLDWVDANHADVTGVLGELKEMRESWDKEDFYRRDKLRVERRHLVNQMFHVGHKKNETLSSLMGTKEEKEGVMVKLEELISSIGDEDCQKKTAELLNVIDKENLLLKEQKTKLEEHVVLLEKTSSNQMKEKQSLLETMAALKSGRPVSHDDSVSETDDTLDSNFSSSSDVSQVKEEEIDAEVVRLRSELESMKEESSRVGLERSDWLMEKETLEDILTDLQERSKEQEDEIQSLKSSEGSAQTSTQGPQKDDSESRIQELENEVASLKEQNQELETALEELDTQHSQALAQLISQRDKILTQLSNQDDEIDKYKTEIKSLNSTIEEMKNNDNEKEQILEKCKKYEQELEEWKQNSKNADQMESKVAELKEKLEKGGLVINDLHMDKQDLEEQLQKAHKEIEVKVSKLKESRMQRDEVDKEKRKMEERLRDAEEKLEETEIELEKWQQLNEDRRTEAVDKHQGSPEVEIECSRLRSKLEDMKNEKEAIKEEFKFMIEGNKDQQGSDAQTQHIPALKDSAFQHILEEELLVRQKLEEDESVIQELKEYIEKLRGERKALKESVAALKSNQDESESLIKSMQLEKDEGLKQLSEKSDDVQHKESELLDMKNTLHNSNEEKLKLQNELTKVEKEKADLENAYLNQEKQYSVYIEELKAGQESGKESIQSLNELKIEMEKMKMQVKDVETMRSSLREKNEEIENLSKDNEMYQNEIKSIKTEAHRLEGLCKDKDSEIESVKERMGKFDQDLLEMEESVHIANEQNDLVMKKKVEENEELRVGKEELETRLNVVHKELELLQGGSQQSNNDEELVKLRQEIDALQSERDVSALTISQLETELSVSEEKITSLKEELSLAIATADSSKSEMANVTKTSHSEVSWNDENNTEGNIEVMERVDAKPLLTSYSQSHSQDTDYGDEDQRERFLELEKEMEKLRGSLIEKDGIVSDLQRSNSSLLELLEKKTDGDNSLGSRFASHKLEAEVKSLQVEREQMMAVVSEKSRENSSLKSEIHRLMDQVSAGHAALTKAQQDTLALEQRQQSSARGDEEDEMKREALNNMARLVRDRETEIEALTQKNNTLLAVLQESNESNAAAHLGPLLKEKEDLTHQMNSMLTEREQLIACVTQKHSESLAFHAEVQRLTVLCHQTQESADKIKSEYAALIPSFEGKNEALIATQKELVDCKQKLKDLEIRHGELMIQRSTSEQDQSSDSPRTDDLQAELEKYKRLESDYKSLVLERDGQIQSLSQKAKAFEDSVSSREAECTHLRKQLENSKFQLTGLMAEIADAKSEKELMQEKSDSKSKETLNLRHNLDQLTLTIKDRDLEVESLKDQISTLNSLLQNQKGNEEDQVSQLIRDHETAVVASRQLQQERDRNAMLAEQRFQECEAMKTELSSHKDKVFKLGRELERLRSHLIEIEEGYTAEALEAEEREKELRNKLAVAEEQLLTSSSHVQLAGQESQRQVESLQQQLHHIASQRDAAYMQVATTQDQCQQYAASLSNLQLVLEHFQKEKDSAIALETEKYQEQANSLSTKVKELNTELEATRADLTEALDGLEAASRISEQLDRKEDALMALKEEVQLREQALKAAEGEIHKLNSSTQAKVDKTLMHNMVLTWLTSPEKKRNEIVQLIGHVLDFSPDDFSKIESAHGQDSLWIGFFRSKPTPKTPSKVDQSFSQLFVKFLERESTPAPEPVQLPVEAMAAEAQSRHKTTFNPFMAPRHVTHGNEVSGSSSGSSSHLLIPQDTPHPSPLFAPVTSVSSTGESAILKDVLDWKR